MSTCGDFSAELVGSFPLPWPGRYLLVRGDRPEAAIVEDVKYVDDVASMTGRFAECLLDRRRFGSSGGSASGADWRQAVTEAFASWPMPDAPAISMGEGTDRSTGASYVIRPGKSDTAMDAVYAVTAAKGSYPVLSLDWKAGALSLSIADGVDRTRSQSDRPVMVFSLEMATASEVSYYGDYSCACSHVIATASGSGDDAADVEVEVDVPGFDPETMWMACAAEDVSSLCSDDPTEEEVAEAGALRAYDHMPALSVDATAMGQGYGTLWNLGDTCEADVPKAGVSCSARVEEVREVVKKDGATLEVSLGSKQITKVARALMRLR